MNVLYLHRKKGIGFSFEKIFELIKKHITSSSIIEFYDKTYTTFFQNILAIRKIDCDVIHITGGIGYYACFLPTSKTILTFHDTNHYEYDLKGFKKWLFGLIYYKLPAKNVSYVTTVSEHTKNKLVHLFGIPPKKIIVIPNCYPPHFTPVPKEQYSNPVKLLQIGTKSNKNIFRVIDAIIGMDVELTIVGKLENNVIELLKSNNIKYVHKTNLSNKEIYIEYVTCDIVLFVSLYEGFGLPIIEANAIGRPVITSIFSPMADVADKAAILVNPYSKDEIREAIQNIIKNKSLRNELIKRGLENSKQYQSTLIAEKYKELYSVVVKSNK